MRKISSNVYVETGNRGCNTSFVVTREGVVMIDTPMVPSEAKKWRDEIAKHGELRYLINGEPHNDHVAGNCFFGGTVVAHEGTRKIIQAAKVEDIKNMLKMMAPDSLPLEEGFHYRPPEVTFSERLTLYLGDHTFQLINLPGHTPYQVAVYVPEERVVFTSDNVIAGMPFLHQAVPYAWLDSLKQLQKLDVDKVVTGHGSICDKGYLSQMSDTIQYWIDSATSAIKKGMGLEEALEKVTLADKYPEAVKDQRMNGIRRMNLTHLYEVLNS
jgi:cyclase